MTPIISKIFEKVIIQLLKENLHISQFQSVGQSGHNVIEKFLYTKSLISFYDFKTCFEDSLKLKDTLINLIFSGINNEFLNLLYPINLTLT